MTNEELISKIKAEIERRQKENFKQAGSFAAGRVVEDADILSFLSSLESEKPMNLEGLEEELDKWRHEHFEKVYQLGRTDMREQMMKEAVEGRVSYFESRDVAVVYYDDPKGNTMCFFAPSSSLETGDKVRIIIVKEDKK